MTRRDYCLHLNPLEGPACIQVNVDDSGAINLEITVSGEEEEKYSLSFSSDSDIKGLIELLRWSRVASLKAQGYQVVM
jgi:hypothetical protein|tara:strand:+ start:41 stop:274 length:234 start_codon:yes stop_codon:yes gene_type:complete